MHFLPWAVKVPKEEILNTLFSGGGLTHRRAAAISVSECVIDVPQAPAMRDAGPYRVLPINLSDWGKRATLNPPRR